MSTFKDKEKTKDGRQWRFKVYYHNSEGKLVPYTSKRYLLEREAKAEERVFLLNRDAPVKKKFCVVADDYFKYAKETIKESTYISYYHNYIRLIKPFFQNKFIDDICVLDIENWKQQLMKNCKVSTCNQYMVALREIFNYANRKYELKYNPVTLAGNIKQRNDNVVDNKEKIRYITYNQFCKFINVIENNLWHCFYYTLYFTGMRKGEICALQWKDIDFEKNKIIVNKTVSFITNEKPFKITSTKTGKNREISMSKGLKEELIKYNKFVSKYADYSSNWFVFGNGTVLRDFEIRDSKEKYFELAKVPPITIHEFRHSHVSLCINEYINSGGTDSTKFFLMMSQRMGHSIRVMQDVYMHLFPSVQDKIVDLLDNL